VLGVQFQAGSTVIASVQRDGPGARGGLAAGDEVIAVGGLRVSASSCDEALLAAGKPGQPIAIVCARRGVLLTLQVTPDPKEARIAYNLEIADSTPAQDTLRRGWLG
jgi:predicted metalloprotease with PDZ domain